MKNRYNELYLNMHPRRKGEQAEATMMKATATASSLQLKAMVSSAQRIEEVAHSAKDIDYDIVEVDVRE